MHKSLVVLMPKVENVEETLKQVLNPFDESNEEGRHPFFDWYVIGGRFSGELLTSGLDLKPFYEELQDNKIKVNGFVSGKEEIIPEHIKLCDEIWQKHFPDHKCKKCPLFKHGSVDQYKHNNKYPDVFDFKDIDEGLTSYMVLFADKGYNGLIEAKFMLSIDHWNGCNIEKTDWNGNIKEAVERFKKDSGYTENYFDNCIGVVVDVHD